MTDTDHGTVYSYRRGCRCEPCRDAKRRNKNEYYARRKARESAGLPAMSGRPKIPLSQRQHGDYVTYCKGCRCDPCTEANTNYGRQHAARVRARNPEDGEVALLRKWADELGYEIHKKRTYGDRQPRD